MRRSRAAHDPPPAPRQSARGEPGWNWAEAWVRIRRDGSSELQRELWRTMSAIHEDLPRRTRADSLQNETRLILRSSELFLMLESRVDRGHRGSQHVRRLR